MVYSYYLNGQLIMLWWRNTFWCQIIHTHINFMYLACDATWYGAGCKSQCGHCFGEDNCHHVNGSCLLGCQEGFTGDFCFKRKFCIHNVDKRFLYKKKTIEHDILIICTYNINFKYGLKKCYISFLYCYYSQMCTLFFSFAQSYILFRTFFYIFCVHMMLNN